MLSLLHHAVNLTVLLSYICQSPYYYDSMTTKRAMSIVNQRVRNKIGDSGEGECERAEKSSPRANYSRASNST